MRDARVAEGGRGFEDGGGGLLRGDGERGADVDLGEVAGGGLAGRACRADRLGSVGSRGGRGGVEDQAGAAGGEAASARGPSSRT